MLERVFTRVGRMESPFSTSERCRCVSVTDVGEEEAHEERASLVVTSTRHSRKSGSLSVPKLAWMCQPQSPDRPPRAHLDESAT